MSLYSELLANDKKGLMKTSKTITSYPTGFTALDFANGSWLAVKKEDGTHEYVPMIGVRGGSNVCIIGSTGTGKTTFGVQIGWNIIKRFEDGMLYLIDCEKTSEYQRLLNLTGASQDDYRLNLIKEDTTIEDVLTRFTEICEIKKAGGKKYMYEETVGSHDGKPFWTYVPTVMIIDSLPAFNSDGFNTEDLGTNVDQMRASKDITRFYTNVLNDAHKYNIIFIVINHIRSKTVMNPYQQPPAELLMLNPLTETLPRGAVAQFFTSTYFRIWTKKASKYTIDDDGFVGYKSEIGLAKSKSNLVGTQFPITFAGSRGFDPIYSIYEFAKDNGLIKGRNPYLYIDGLEDFKFNRKEFNTKMIGIPEFRNAVLSHLKPYFMDLLGPQTPVLEEERIDLDILSV